MLPDDGARSKIQAQQLPLLHALLHAAVIGSIAIAIESALETGVRFAAHRGGHEDAVAPHDGIIFAGNWKILKVVPGRSAANSAGSARSAAINNFCVLPLSHMPAS